LGFLLAHLGFFIFLQWQCCCSQMRLGIISTEHQALPSFTHRISF